MAECSRRITLPPNGTCSSIQERRKLSLHPARRSDWFALDATQRVPIDMALARAIRVACQNSTRPFVSQVLATNRDDIRQGFYFAWDPLAAVALANPAVVTFRPMAIEISDDPEELGRTVEVQTPRANAQVAIDADALRFREIFMTALGVH